MKKYILSLFLVFLYSLANASGTACLQVRGQDEVIYSVNSLPHADLDLSAQGGITNSHFNHTGKRITGDGPLILKDHSFTSPAVLSIRETASSVYSKRYLLHIHPTHHFW